MPYATSDDLVIRFGEQQLLLLADRDGDQVIDAAVVDPKIADASAIVDMHVRGRYGVPLEPVPREITGIVCDLVRRALYGDATEVPESVLSADKAARDLLKLIADGKVQLDTAPAPATDTGGALEVETAGPAPFFTDDSLKGF